MDARKILYVVVAIVVAIGLAMGAIFVVGIALLVALVLRLLFWFKKPDIEAMQDRMMREQEMYDLRNDDGVIDLEPNEHGEYGGRDTKR